MSATDTFPVLENTADSQEDDKVSGMLVNVFGLKLPNEMFSAAARSASELAQMLQEYAKAVEKPKQH